MTTVISCREAEAKSLRSLSHDGCWLNSALLCNPSDVTGPVSTASANRQ